MTKIAIMQPTFIPWMGYFAMIDFVDTFVFLDDVQFVKRSWQCRNQIKSANGALMLHLEMLGTQHRPLIKDARLHARDFENRLFKSIEHNLKKAPYFDIAYHCLIESFKESDRSLVRLNQGFIQRICDLASIQTNFVNSSELVINGLSKSARLFEICKKLNARTYISPQGSADYLKIENFFDDSEVELQFFNFEHPRYQQLYGTFLPFMSVIDLVSNIASGDLKEILRSGIKPALNIDQV